ncbi:MAG: class I SAM-dependent methyltransferase [Desulfobacterales bacterium]
MKDSRRSLTAESAAAARAAHFVLNYEPIIFEDPYAAYFIGGRWKWMIQKRVILRLITANFLFGWARPVVGQILARSRYSEDRFEKAFGNDISQYVLLGAGMDSFAMRRPELEEAVKIYEVDHPSTQEWKKGKLSENSFTPPSNVVYIPIDFEKESLAQVLTSSPFQNEIPAFFSWLGTTYYLTKNAVFETFKAISSCAAKGSEVVFDYACSDADGRMPDTKTIKKVRKFTKRRGEEMITAFSQQELFDELKKVGFTLQEDLDTNMQNERYFANRSDGLEAMRHTHIASVKLERPVKS